MKRLLKNTRFHLLLLAFSLFVISSIFGLSAYIMETQTYSGTFRTATGEDLGFSVSGNEFSDELITPGKPVTLEAIATVSGTIPMYVFADLNVPREFTIGGLNAGWHLIPGSDTVYYYGSSDSLVEVGPGNPSVDIFDTITLSSGVSNGQSYAVSVTGYAIQSYGIAPNTDPSAVFQMITTEP